MNTLRNWIAGLVAISAVGLASPAFADTGWGTVEQARACMSEFADSDGFQNNWGGSIYVDQSLINKAIKDGKVSAACKTEIDRFATSCKADKSQRDRQAKDPDWCTQRGYLEIRDLLQNDPERQRLAKEKEAAAAKAAALAEAAKVELPKAEKRDKTVEKQIAAAYKAAYPDNTVLMVLLQSKRWETERSDWGVITNRNFQAIVVNKQPDGTCQLHNEMWMQEYVGGRFKGPLSQRGAGSQRLTPILCEKVPGAAKPAKPAKHTK